MGAGRHTGISKTYFSINKEGRVKHKNEAGEIELYDYLEGRLISIEPKDGEYEGQKTFRINIVLEDGGELLALECGRFSGFGRDLITKLINSADYQKIRLTPFISVDKVNNKEYIRGSVRSNNEKIQLTDDEFALIPKVDIVKIGNKEIVDDTERNVYIDNLIEKLSAKVKAWNNIMDDSPVDNLIPAGDLIQADELDF